MNTSNDKPDLRVVQPADKDKLPDPIPITALVPPEIKPAIDALVRIQLGTGTLDDLAEIALTVNNGRTEFTRLWFLEAVPEALKELQTRIQEAGYANRWGEAAVLRERRQGFFLRLQKRLERSRLQNRLARDLPKRPGERG